MTFPTDDGDVRAVRGVSFTLGRGETIGVVGESGSGKSTIALAMLGLLPRSARVTGSVRCQGKELIGQPEKDLAKVRSSTIAYIPQDPLTSLNPAFTVGRQVAETIWTRGHVDKEEAHKKAIELLELVGIPNAARRVDDYPARVLRRPAAADRDRDRDGQRPGRDDRGRADDRPRRDHPGPGARRAARRPRQAGASLMLITHDLGVVAGMADRVMVMYAGKAVEAATADVLFLESKMPYTLGLLGSLPRLDTTVREPLRPIPGSPPSLINLPDACPFAPRCPAVIPRCREEEPALNLVEPGHEAACIRATSLPNGGVDLFAPTWTDTESEGVKQETLTVGEMDGAAAPATVGATLVSVHDIVKHFPVRAGTFVRRTVAVAHAVNDVSFDLAERETLGLVGESGSGKSTTARVVLQLLPATSGSVKFEGTELVGKSRKEMRPFRRQLQMVFQDPFASLDPRMPVGEIVGEPLKVHGRWGRASGPKRVAELFEMVGLNPEHRNRYPHEFSGGQRQRVGVARALALGPKVLILDEPVSALDVSIQAGVVNLLEELQDRLDLAYLFIAHDLSVVRHISDRVAVMYLGRIVETGTVDEVYDSPSHPYTQALLSAVPVPDPKIERERRRILLTGEVPNAINPPSGCRFRTRCWKAQDICAAETPALVERGQGHPVACHFADATRVIPTA